MKNLIFHLVASLLLLVSYHPICGQEFKVANGASVSLDNYASVKVEGDVEFILNSALNNSGDLSLIGNWKNDQGLGISGNGWVHFNGDSIQKWNGGGVSIPKIELDNQLGMELDQTGAGVIDSLSFQNGILTTNSEALSLGISCEIAGAGLSRFIRTNNTGTVNIPLENTPKLIPIGTSDSLYFPVEIDNSPASDTGWFSIRVEDGAVKFPGSVNYFDSNQVKATWELMALNGISNATVKLHWDTSAVYMGFDPTLCGVADYQANQWVIQNLKQAVSSGGLKYRDFTGIQASTYFIVSSDQDFPVPRISPIKEAEFEFLLFPNPSSGRFTVSFGSPQKGNVQFLLFDSFGKLVFDQSKWKGEEIFKEEIDVVGLAAGIYFLQIHPEWSQAPIKPLKLQIFKPN